MPHVLRMWIGRSQAEAPYIFFKSPDHSGPAINRKDMKEIDGKYLDLVYRTAFRIMCDRIDSGYVTSRVFSPLNDDVKTGRTEGEFEDVLLRRTALFCRIRFAGRRLMLIAGEHPQVFVRASPVVEDHDDYTVKQAWQLYCRACFRMTPLQCIVYALAELEGIDEVRVASILGLSEFRVRHARHRAEHRVRSELDAYGCARKYAAYVGFIRKVAESQRPSISSGA